MDKICTLSIEYLIDGDGLVGGKYEYNPYVATHATFGAYRKKEKDFLQCLNPQKQTLNTGRRGVGLRAAETANQEEAAASICMSSESLRYRSTKPLVFELMAYDQMKGDDSIHFRLFSHTRYSGVDSIDKNEAAYHERQVPSGICQLELFDLFQFYLQSCGQDKVRLGQEKVVFEVTGTFEDQKIIDEKTRHLLRSAGHSHPTDADTDAMMQEAKPLSEKAKVTFQVTFLNFNEALFKKSIFAVPDLKQAHVHSRLPLAQRHSGSSQSGSLASTYEMPRKNYQYQRQFEPLLYNSSKSWQMWMTSMNRLLKQYIDHFISEDDNSTPLQCLYKPCDPVVSNLQFPLYQGECGKLPVYAFWANHDPYYREYASPEARLHDMQIYGFNDKTERYFLLLLRSSLRRFGLSEETLIHEVENHFSPQNSATCPSPNFLRVEEVIADIGTAAANSIDYTADYRFMLSLNTLNGTRNHDHKNLGELRHCTECVKQATMKVLSLDSWDNFTLNGTSRSGDCEDDDNVATSVIRSFNVGRPDLAFTWESKALQAVKKYLEHTVIYDVAALVTSAFMDTNNKKVEVKQEDLPLIGSELDKNAQNDGHCFALMQPLSRCIEMLEAGNVKAEVIAKVRQGNSIGARNKQEEDTFRQRDCKRRMLVLEPTGSIEARLLPLAESFGEENCEDPDGHLFAKKKAMFYFMKHMRALLKDMEKTDKEMATGILDLFVGEGLPHYVDRQVPQRRTSSFYNSVVHGSSVDLMRFDSTLSQFAFCKQNKYGVRIGELIRDSSHSNLSLVCPYANYGEKWHSEIVPMVESIENQMPIMTFGRYKDEEYEHEIYSRYIAPHEMSATFSFEEPSAYSTTKESREAQTRFETTLKEVDSLASDKTVVRLYSRVWKLNQNAEKTQHLTRFLKEMPGLVDYAFYVERHLPVCSPVVEILCIVNVDKCLSLPVIVK